MQKGSEPSSLQAAMEMEITVVRERIGAADVSRRGRFSELRGSDGEEA